jgi:rare lipoprotein A
MRLARFLLAFCALIALNVPAATAKTREVLMVASWYGPGFAGKPMANGLPFNPMDSTIVANKTLPLGTILTIRNPENDRRLRAIVQDRGPYAKGRQLDLTFIATDYLGYADRGTARLEVSISPRRLRAAP